MKSILEGMVIDYKAPDFILETNYLTVMGSKLYKTNLEDSDNDFLGFVIPPMEYINPLKKNIIPGYGDNPYIFSQIQNHHIIHNDNEYDITIYNFSVYMNLLTNGNPNIIDSMFSTADNKLIHDEVSDLVYKNRSLFLSKQVISKLKGYANSQLQKAKFERTTSNPKRSKLISKYGYDTKYASHVVRLISQAEDLIKYNDILLDKNAEIILEVKTGKWDLQDVEDFLESKISLVDNLKDKSSLPENPDTDKIKELMFKCFEMKYGKDIRE